MEQLAKSICCSCREPGLHFSIHSYHNGVPGNWTLSSDLTPAHAHTDKSFLTHNQSSEAREGRAMQYLWTVSVCLKMAMATEWDPVKKVKPPGDQAGFKLKRAPPAYASQALGLKAFATTTMPSQEITFFPLVLIVCFGARV